MPDEQEISSQWQRKPGNPVFRVITEKPWRQLISPVAGKSAPRASLWTLIYGFAVMILIGFFLLMLPVSNNSGEFTAPVTALFTATSAVCVTGLVVVDTLNHWSLFGQIVILVLIQLGGFGYMTMTTLLLIALGRRIGLRERLLIGQSMGLARLGGIVGLVRNMVIFTIGIEFIGAVIFFIRFSSQFPFWTAVWKSVFHGVSAFNNAGFDLFGDFRSLTAYHNDYLVVITTAILVILGGISFLVVYDMFRNRKYTRFSVDTKMVLFVSLALLIVGTLVVLVTEYANSETIAGMPLGDKILNSFFQSVTSRSSGFSTFTTGNMTDYALFFTMLLMFIGGASGSMAGGVKINTFGLIMATIWSEIRGREHPGAFNREFMVSQVFRALAVLVMGIGIVGIVAFVLSITEGLDFIGLLFEAVSAFGIVGLSTGITPDLSIAGQLVVIVTMFIGRLGPLTMVLAMVRAQRKSIYRDPKEIIRIG